MVVDVVQVVLVVLAVLLVLVVFYIINSCSPSNLFCSYSSCSWASSGSLRSYCIVWVVFVIMLQSPGKSSSSGSS